MTVRRRNIDNKAILEGTFIEKGVSVEILSVDGNRIVVRETNN